MVNAGHYWGYMANVLFVLIPCTQVDMEEKLKLEVKGKQKKMVKRTYIPYMV